MSTSNKRAIAYVRQSSARAGETAQDALSLEAQEAAIQRYCAERGYSIVRTIRDHDLSGEDWDRPGIKELLAAADAGGIEDVVVFKLSRFARDVLYQELTHRELKKRGVGLLSVTEAGIDKTLIRMVYGGMAQQYNEDHRDWLKQTLKSRANRGLHHGRPPYGYIVPPGTDRTNRRLEPHPDEAPVVRRVYEMRLTGLGPIAIANRLNAEGIPAKNGGVWWSSSIRQMLRVPTYAGYAVYQGAIVGDLDPSNATPIIPRHLWHQVQGMWAPGRAPKAHEDRKSWVQGLVKHGCGLRMWYVHTVGPYNGYTQKPGLLCASGARPSAVKCTLSRKHVRLHPVETAAEMCLVHDLGAIPATVQAVIERHLTVTGAPGTIARRADLERQRDHIRASIKRAEGMVVSGLRDHTWFTEQDLELQTQLLRLTSAIAELETIPDVNQLAPLHASILSARDAIPLLTDEQKFEFLAGLGMIVVAPEGIHIDYNSTVRPLFPSPVAVNFKYTPGKNRYSYEIL